MSLGGGRGVAGSRGSASRGVMTEVAVSAVCRWQSVSEEEGATEETRDDRLVRREETPDGGGGDDTGGSSRHRVIASSRFSVSTPTRLRRNQFRSDLYAK